MKFTLNMDLNFHPVSVPLIQLLEVILDFGIWPPVRMGHNGLRPGGIADLLNRFALSLVIRITKADFIVNINC